MDKGGNTINLKKIMKAFELAYRTPEAKALLRPDWREANKNAPHSTGFCYIAAEACHHLLGCTTKAFYAAYEEDGKRCTHWWLKKNGRIIDPTVSQYLELGETPPYHLGKGAGFLTRFPSKRAKSLMDIVSSL